ncbi:MAG: hypothetical protein FWF51_07510 [Chitinivibrionia bacterium]|nr:hypothetical protein [Chitinivibrionia bacterium]
MKNTKTFSVLSALIATLSLFFISCNRDDDKSGVQGNGLAEKLIWLQNNAQSGGSYVIKVRDNEGIGPKKLYYENKSNITVTLKGEGSNRAFLLSSNGSMFTVGSGVTLVLDSITLYGVGNNSNALVSIDSGATLKMSGGSAISGNSYGVFVGKNGNFIMNGGAISNNVGYKGRNVDIGGVYVFGGNFAMSGGTVSGNIDGGVDVRDGNFTMSGGTVSGNIDGGVYVGKNGVFTMSGGEISDNMGENGGGVSVSDGGNFVMDGGVISGNFAKSSGGGVYVGWNAAFTKNGGSIIGYASDPNKGNAVKNNNGIIARKGHAIYVNSAKRKETTAESDINLFSGSSEGWDE